VPNPSFSFTPGKYSADARQLFAGEHFIGALGLNQFQERPGAGRKVLVNDDITYRIVDTDEHGVGVQIDAAVKLCAASCRIMVQASFGEGDRVSKE
jgi:hypothetical protein